MAGNNLRFRKIKTLQTLKVSGIPSAPRDQKAYLDLYILEKEKDRLMQEISMIEEKRGILQKKIDSITEKMGKCQKTFTGRGKKK
jgi:predicted  nucleic acid-binding Zn-ribbon protein